MDSGNFVSMLPAFLCSIIKSFGICQCILSLVKVALNHSDPFTLMILVALSPFLPLRSTTVHLTNLLFDPVLLVSFCRTSRIHRSPRPVHIADGYKIRGIYLPGGVSLYIYEAAVFLSGGIVQVLL